MPASHAQPPGTRVYDVAPHIEATVTPADPGSCPVEVEAVGNAAVAYAQMQAVGSDRARRRWQLITVLAVVAGGLSVLALAFMVTQDPQVAPAPPAQTVTEFVPTTTTDTVTETATATTTSVRTSDRTSRVTETRTEVTRELRTSTVTVTATVTAPGYN